MGHPPTADEEDHPTSYVGALAAALAAFAALGVLFLFPYVTGDVGYPLGFGATIYVSKARAVAGSGLDLLGTIRVGGALLLAILAPATGQNGFTLAAIVPALLTGAVGLGAAAMARAALGVRAVWVPVLAFLTWVVLVSPGVLDYHFDNLVNAALTLAAFAAAIAFADRRRGALAVALLFMAAALTHWPFYLFAAIVFLLAVAAHVWLPLGAAWASWPERLRGSWPLLGAVGASGVFTALTFLSTPPNGWIGLKVRHREPSQLLGRRFRIQLRELDTYFAIPFGAAGAIACAGAPSPPGCRAGRRLFWFLVGSWILLTLAAAGSILIRAAVGALRGVPLPTAGGRLIDYLFPLTLLAGLAVWWAARRLAGWGGRGAGAIAATAVVLTVMAGFGILTARWWGEHRSWVDPVLVQQAATAGMYLQEVAPGRNAVLVLRNIRSPVGPVVQSSVPADQLGRIFLYYGTPAEYLAGVPPRGGYARAGPNLSAAGANPGPAAVAILLERNNETVFAEEAGSLPGRVAGPGVLILRGPLPPAPLPPAPIPAAAVGLGDMVGISALVLLIVFLAGGGWAATLLPDDPTLRVLLAPALGIAVMLLTTLAWDRVGLSIAGSRPLIPLAVCTLAGWGAALVRRVRVP